MDEIVEYQYLRLTHKGTLEIGDSKIPCAVLEDGTRVISETGISNAILKTRSGAAIRKKSSQEVGAQTPVFLAAETLKPFISKDLNDGAHSINYLDGKRVVRGYDASILPIVCDVWLSARDAGALKPSQLDKAQNAEILMRSLAKVGIIALIDEATGYQEARNKNELNRFLSMYLSNERLTWAKVFPDEYYKQLFRLLGWNYNPMTVKRPQYLGKLTNEIVYERLPADVLEKLRELNPVKNKKTHRREAAHHQYLSTELGQPDLHNHIMQVIALQRASSSMQGFMRLLDKALPKPNAGEQLEIEGSFEDE